MRKRVWSSFLSLALLVGAVITPAPVVAAATSHGGADPTSPESWVVEGYEILLRWIDTFVPAIVNQHSTSDGASPEGETSLQSAGCELQTCTEAGVTIDPNG